YRLHFDLHYLPVVCARYIVRCCAMFMLVPIISGIITHKKIFKDFFTFRPGKGQRSWLDFHNASAVLALPYHAMITYT
ncbi:PepSY-associated TM helix domain-containing protein, partial [Burkholderia sp. SIMBA_024]|uniref:PepSY-associated TM helix domain-containing protein n=1 Tax=Burkholderia sp. SIMBA_024 TaxID=3085768 RepID=UPI00397BCC99